MFKKSLLATSIVLLSTASLAQDTHFNYSYVDLSVTKSSNNAAQLVVDRVSGFGEAGNNNDDYTGIKLEGSYDVGGLFGADGLHFVMSYQAETTDNNFNISTPFAAMISTDVDVELFRVGAGYASSITEDTDVFGRIGYAELLVNLSSGASSSEIVEAAPFVEAGFRSKAGPVELNLTISRYEYGRDKVTVDPYSAFEVGALYHINDTFAIGGSAAVTEDNSTFEATGRYSF